MPDVATKQDIENILALLQQNFERIDRRFESVDRRFDSMESRLDRISETLAGVQTQMAAMTRWSDRFDRDHIAVTQTQAAQQRAIDDLASRVTKLEGRKAS